MGNAEVHDLDVAIGLHHDVLRLDVAMDQILVVSNVERRAHLRTNFRNFALVERAARLDAGLQIGAADELHHNVVRAVIVAPVVDVHNVGTLQVGGSSGFLLETLGEIGAFRILGQHHLYGNGASQHGILSTVDFRHAPHANAFCNFIAVAKDPSYEIASHLFTP